MYHFKNLKDVDVAGKRVLLRAAFDVPIKDGVVVSDYRIRAVLPTIEYLLKKNCRVAILSWLGRPQGRVVEAMRLGPVAAKLEELLGRPVAAVNDCIGPSAQAALFAQAPGSVVVLENVRFHDEEMDNDAGLAAELVRPFDLIVFDAFAQSHRAQSSTTGILNYRPAVVGFGLEKELAVLTKAAAKPTHPAVLVVGGAKVSDKVALIERLISRFDMVLVGGVCANVFLAARGDEPLGQSFLSDVKLTGQHRSADDPLVIARRLLKKYRRKIVLPVDLRAAKNASGGPAKVVTLAAEDIDPTWAYFDLGPKTIRKFTEVIAEAKTVIWNGPMGRYEEPRFATGTKAVARAIAANRGLTVAGGGDSEEIIGGLKLLGKFNHVSTGGGAMLEFLTGAKLPALEALAVNQRRQSLVKFPPPSAADFLAAINPFWRQPLLNLRQLLPLAQAHKFAIPACNIRSKYILDGVLQAAFAERSPIILELAESEMEYCHISPQKLADWLAERLPKLEKKYGYSIPIALHADHVKHDVAGVVTAAVRAGFSSLLIDQSHATVRQNTATVRDVVSQVHPLGISVEGEIGQINVAQQVAKQLVGAAVWPHVPTVAQAAEFVAATGIDAFAGFFGNYHGHYREPATIAWTRMKQIAKVLGRVTPPVPLVLHGTSFLRTKELDHIQVYHRAIACGCHKVNYGTMLSDILHDQLPPELVARMTADAGQNGEWKKMLGQYAAAIDCLSPAAKKKVVNAIAEHVAMMMRRAWRSSHKAWLYRQWTS